jgi:4-hydroxy-2-oxoheptanedioate aldolase
MKTNTVKRRMLAGEAAVGVVMGLGSPVAAQVLSNLGYDFVMIDNQHGAWDDESSMHAFRNICLGSALPMTRVRQNDFYVIGRLLDRGALGIVVPMVNSAAEAQAAAYAVRYPPRGGRSWAPTLARYHGSDYDTWIDDEVFLAVQIESKQAVDRAEEILAVDGVDGCWLGPADLARSMAIDLKTREGKQAHEAAIQRVLDACRRTGKIPGFAAGADAGLRLEQGFLFVTAGSDGGLLASGTEQLLARLGRRP